MRCKISARILFLGDSLTKGTPGVSCFSILERMLPGCDLMNWGKGGDSALSLYQRLQRRPFPEAVDVAFLWVGVNDVFVHTAPAFAPVRRLLRQPWSPDLPGFEANYRKLLAFLQPRVKHVITVPPLLIGEQMDGRWNQALEPLAAGVERISAQYYVSRYIPLRKTFREELAGEASSSYIASSLARILFDSLLLRDPEQVDAVSARRGLRLTLDGVHLNSRGAQMAAQEFYAAICALLGAGVQGGR